MSKHFLLTLYMILACLFMLKIDAKAQTKNVEEWDVVVKFAPLVLLEPEGGYQVGFEAPIGKRWSTQNEFAYLCYYWNNNNMFGDIERNEIKVFNGYVLKTEARYYFFDGDLMEGLYIGPQFQYKYVFRKAVNFGFSDPWNQNPQEVEFKHYTEVAKLNFKMGYQAISKKGFAFDFYTGAGGRMAWSKTVPSGFEEEFFVQTEFPINFMLGFRIGWAI